MLRLGSLEDAMRVLVSVDMEGVAGVVDPEDVLPGHLEHERNRVLLTSEASAAVRGVFAYEPSAEVLVTEGHAGFRNLLPDRLDRRAELLRGKPKPAGMMAGITDEVDAVLFIGYHGKAGTARSVLAHTIHSGVIADLRCNGHSLGELGLNTALAAHSGVPAVMVSGDDTVAVEAREVAPGMHTVVVKRALGARTAASLHPEEACERIERAVPPALAERKAVQPLRFDGPVELEVDVLTPYMTERALLVPGMELKGSRTLHYSASNFPTVYRVAQLITVLAGIKSLVLIRPRRNYPVMQAGSPRDRKLLYIPLCMPCRSTRARTRRSAYSASLIWREYRSIVIGGREHVPIVVEIAQRLPIVM